MEDPEGRLRNLTGNNDENPDVPYTTAIQDDLEDENEEFYTPATAELITVRQSILKFSITAMKKRLQLRREVQHTDISKIILNRRKINAKARQLKLVASQLVESRPISTIAVAPHHPLCAVGGWGGKLTLLDPSTMETCGQQTIAHQGKIGGLGWHKDGNVLASGAQDSLINLYTLTDNHELKLTSTLTGHQNRVTDTVFHPSGQYIASSSFDTTWRLWNVENGKELQIQEGHSKELYCVGFQSDGSILCSAGLDNIGLIWDIRSGENIMSLKGHSKPIFTLDWSSNGHQIATGGGDGMIYIWDLRKPTDTIEKIAAHSNIVTCLKFSKPNGDLLYSGSYDKKINVYSSDNWLRQATLEGHIDKILSLDVANETVLSGGWDRTVKLWNVTDG